MIGDERTTSRAPLAPISTGQVRMLAQLATAASAHAGGSVSETKLPPAMERIVWAPTKDSRRASSRVAFASAPGVTFSILTLTLIEEAPIRSARTRITPAIVLVSRTIRADGVA